MLSYISTLCYEVLVRLNLKERLNCPRVYSAAFSSMPSAFLILWANIHVRNNAKIMLFVEAIVLGISHRIYPVFLGFVCFSLIAMRD